MLLRRVASSVFILVAGLWLLAGCLPSDTNLPLVPATPAATPIPTPTMPIFDLIAVVGDGVPASVLDDVAAALHAGAPAVCDALEIPCDFPVAVEVFAGQAAFDQGTMNPAMRGFFALSGDGLIQMVSPANSGLDELSYEDGVGVAVHEFVHLALDRINPDLPDWLDEGTAVLLGPHDLYDRACHEQLPDFVPPPLADLREHYDNIPAPDLYAYTLVTYIVDTGGLHTLNRLLRSPQVSVEFMLGKSTLEVEAEWRAFVSRGCLAASPAN